MSILRIYNQDIVSGHLKLQAVLTLYNAPRMFVKAKYDVLRRLARTPFIPVICARKMVC